MTYNEWCEYAQFGQACEYDNQILNFVEQYNNAKHQQFINRIENDRANRQVQGVANFWHERGDILPTDINKAYGSDEVYSRPNYQEVYSSVLRW
jgi:hypothetical protein